MNRRVYYNLVKFITIQNIDVLVSQLFQTDFLWLSWIILFEANWQLICIIDKYVPWLWFSDGFESLPRQQLSTFKNINVVGWLVEKKTLRI